MDNSPPQWIYNPEITKKYKLIRTFDVSKMPYDRLVEFIIHRSQLDKVKFAIKRYPGITVLIEYI
jgi:hypothetical protein